LARLDFPEKEEEKKYWGEVSLLGEQFIEERKALEETVTWEIGKRTCNCAVGS
jgi:hypothetical protein